MDFEKCTEIRKDKIIVVEEKGRKFELINEDSKLIGVVKVDDCLIDDHRERCDYLFEIMKPISDVIYLELKGEDIQKAYNQLVETLGYCRDRHLNISKCCHIVASRVPKAGPKVQVLKKKMVSKYRVQLIVNTQKARVLV